MTTILWLASALLLVLFSAHLFTNGVEWLGKRLGVSHGVIGSLLAGIGTALPETTIPIIAILFGGGNAAHRDVGVGAILGAPFMLAALTLPLAGAAVLVLAALRRRDGRLRVNPTLAKLDLGYFIIAYGLAIACALTPHALVRYAVAGALVALYGHYVWRLNRLDRQQPVDEILLAPLIFSPRNPRPSLAPILGQVAGGLAGIIAGASLFVDAVTTAATTLAVPPLLLSLLITPIATELPEKFNSLIWIAQRKDHLAVANITGAMVFQATFPVAVGLLGTDWQLDWHGWVTGVGALLAAVGYWALLALNQQWRPWQLALGAALYVGFAALVLWP